MTSNLFRALALGLTIGLLSLPAQAGTRGYANPQLLTTVQQLQDIIYREEAVAGMGAENTLRIIDVRSREAFAGGHVPGAINIPSSILSDPHGHFKGALKTDAVLARLFGSRGIDAKSEVVIYGDKDGLHSAQLFWLLEYFGHRRVSLLDGGIKAWVAQGNPLERRRTAAHGNTEFALNRAPRRYASADWILEHRKHKNTVVIDVRPAKMHAAGHIPWAKNIPWKQNLKSDGTVKSARNLRAHFEAHGITPDKTIVVHCQAGQASSHSYFALRLLGYPRVRTYHRSWAEWGSADDLPKAVSGEG